MNCRHSIRQLYIPSVGDSRVNFLQYMLRPPLDLVMWWIFVCQFPKLDKSGIVGPSIERMNCRHSILQLYIPSIGDSRVNFLQYMLRPPLDLVMCWMLVWEIPNSDTAGTVGQSITHVITPQSLRKLYQQPRRDARVNFLQSSLCPPLDLVMCWMLVW